MRLADARMQKAGSAEPAKLLYEQREFFTTPVRAFFSSGVYLVEVHGMNRGFLSVFGSAYAETS